MKRREFVFGSMRAVGTAWFASQAWVRALPALPRKFAATDTVTLGKTGIQTSRLAMGTGTVGSGGHSHQTALGVKGLSELLLNGYDQGLRFFDSADSYGSHPHVAEALKHVSRDQVTVLTKTWARDAASARADLERFRRELGVDHIDVCLMHCPDGGRLDGAVSGSDGCVVGGEGERCDSGAWMFVPQHRGAAGGGKVAVGGGGPGANQSHWISHGCGSCEGGGRAARDEGSGKRDYWNEDFGARRFADSTGRGFEICAGSGRGGRVYDWGGESG